MTRVLQRSIAHSYPVAVRGEGIHIWDATGKHYIDASGGAAVSCLGHGHPDVLAAMHAQLDKLAYAHTSFFTTRSPRSWPTTWSRMRPPGISHVYFVSGGSEAIEAALKMARQYFVETRRAAAPPLHRPPPELSRQHAGRAGGRRQRMAPQAVRAAADRDASRLACFEYRGQRAGRDADEAYGERARRRSSKPRSTSSAPRRSSPSSPRPWSAPPPAPCRRSPGYFKRIREICDRHGMLLILDEVMCGMGRTGTLHACEQEGIAPDLMTIAKGLGGGYAPIGAVLRRRQDLRRLRQGLGLLPARPHLSGPSARLRGARSPCSRSSGATICSPTCARRASTWRGGSASASATTIMSATSAAAACSRRSSWSPIARTKAPFDPKLKLHARIKQAGHGARPDGLSDGRHDRRRARRPRAAGAALHRRCRPTDRHDRRAARRDAVDAAIASSARQHRSKERVSRSAERSTMSNVAGMTASRAGRAGGAGATRERSRRRRSRNSSPSAPAASPASITRSAARSAG